MTANKNELLESVPHFEMIVPNGKITIPSIFMFKGGHSELFPFLYACEKMNCDVVFANENIIVPCDDPNASFTKFILSIYAHIAEHPKIAEDYIRYLTNLERMSWNNSVHEPIMKSEE